MTDTQNDSTSPPPHCSFCDKGEAEVRKLIAGHSAYICDECAELCIAVVGAPAIDNGIQNSLTRIWAELTMRRQWTAAVLVGALSQLAEREAPEPKAWSRGAKMTSYVINQLNPPPHLRPDKVLRCDYCSKDADQTEFLHVSHDGQICGDCLENKQVTRAWLDPAYREDLIKRLNALADMPEPPS